MPERIHGGVFNQQVITGSQRYFVIEGADFSGSFENGQPVPYSAAEIIFNVISQKGYINIMNPYDIGISFALEIGRSSWTAESLQEAIRALGDDVGVDHIDCSDCIVIEVPFNFQYLNSGGTNKFIDLVDVEKPSIPNGYVLWNSTGTVLEYSTTIPYTSISGSPAQVNKIIAGSNIVITPSSGTGDVTISASGTLSGTIIVEDEGVVLGPAGVLNFTGDGVTATFDGTTATVDISAGGSNETDVAYIPVAAGATLEINKRYFVTSAGTVFLPNFTSLSAGDCVIVTKSCPNTNVVTVFSVNGLVSIATDIGSTDSIEIDSTVEAIFVYNGTSWNLQIGSIGLL